MEEFMRLLRKLNDRIASWGSTDDEHALNRTG